MHKPALKTVTLSNLSILHAGLAQAVHAACYAQVRHRQYGKLVR